MLKTIRCFLREVQPLTGCHLAPGTWPTTLHLGGRHRVHRSPSRLGDLPAV